MASRKIYILAFLSSSQIITNLGMVYLNPTYSLSTTLKASIDKVFENAK